MRRTVVACAWVVLAGCTGAAARPERPVHAAVPQPASREAKRALFAEAYGHIEAQRFAQAAPLLEALLPSYPELEDYSLHYLALSRARLGDTTRAIDLWTRLASTQARSLQAPAAALERGRILRRQGDLAAAKRLLAFAEQKGSGQVAQAATFELAEIDAANGAAAAAHRRLMSLRQQAPDTPLGRRAKQRVTELRQNDPKLGPRGAAAFEDEVRLLIREGDFAAARATAQRLLATAPPSDQPVLLRLRADAEHAAGNLEQALTTLRRIVRHHADSAAAPEALYRHASLLWNQDRNRDAKKGFLDFRRRYSGHARTPAVLYALARIEQGEGQTEQAVASYGRLVRAYPAARLAREASWHIGWIRYQQGRWRDAADAFARLARGRPIKRAADARYWQARALERAGDRGGGARIYRQLLERAPETYYAQLAKQRLGEDVTPARRILAQPRPDHIDQPPAVTTDSYHLIRARELQAAGLRRLARTELRAFESANPRHPRMVSFLTTAYAAADGYSDAIRLARASRLENPEVLYPLAFWPLINSKTRDVGLDPLLVLALIRQESMFDPAARSPADARGLMQLMPSTAERVAQRLGRPSPLRQLYEPEINLALGIAYLEQLLQLYHRNLVKALAAYNGGEQAVARWERRFGHLEPDEFVESITYRETRNYVKKVLANYCRYRRHYAANQPASAK